MNMHLLHEWSDWSEPHLDAWGGEGKLLQTRCCTQCNKVQIGRVRMPRFSRPNLSDVTKAIAEMQELQGEKEN